MEGCCIVVLILFSQKAKIFVFSSKIHFHEKRNFRIFVGNFRKKENDFCSYFHENFAKIFFRPNSRSSLGMGIQIQLGNVDPDPSLEYKIQFSLGNVVSDLAWELALRSSNLKKISAVYENLLFS